jgi:hypothetical protein
MIKFQRAHRWRSSGGTPTTTFNNTCERHEHRTTHRPITVIGQHREGVEAAHDRVVAVVADVAEAAERAMGRIAGRASARRASSGGLPRDMTMCCIIMGLRAVRNVVAGLAGWGDVQLVQAGRGASSSWTP